MEELVFKASDYVVEEICQARDLAKQIHLRSIGEDADTERQAKQIVELLNGVLNSLPNERAAAVKDDEEECIYCGQMSPPAPPTDEEGWIAAASQHRSGCEWIETRAHTR